MSPFQLQYYQHQHKVYSSYESIRYAWRDQYGVRGSFGSIWGTWIKKFREPRARCSLPNGRSVSNLPRTWIVVGCRITKTISNCWWITHWWLDYARGNYSVLRQPLFTGVNRDKILRSNHTRWWYLLYRRLDLDILGGT